ncbi:carboxymuconolactone decarboxylase family protein [Ferrovibrio sp.]|uniref:carboxymuconolactone decarboxylase family protein n=1 Tax=Ferrovibrio sp. TaxID=1917215 RepID=UPI0035B25429
MNEPRYTDEQNRLKQQFIEARGYWRPWTEALLRHSPEFLSAYARHGGYPAEHGPLTALERELVYVALDASSTHLFSSGLKLHIGLALQCGATPQQIVAVFHLATAQGLEGCHAGAVILAEELAASGLEPARLDDEQLRLKRDYEASFGDWPASCDHLLRMDPGYFASMIDFLKNGRPSGALSDRMQSLLALALSACFTAADRDSTRLHIRRALRSGASQADILQVLQMTAHLGVHACALGMPLLDECLDSSGRGA